MNRIKPTDFDLPPWQRKRIFLSKRDCPVCGLYPCSTCCPIALNKQEQQVLTRLLSKSDPPEEQPI